MTRPSDLVNTTAAETSPSDWYWARSTSVFALTLGGEPWVEITDSELDPGYLWGVPMCLFEIVNPRLSALWEARVAKYGELRLEPPSLSRRNYQDDLFEGVEEVVADFRRIRQELEQEADLHRRAASTMAVLS